MHEYKQIEADGNIYLHWRYIYQRHIRYHHIYTYGLQDDLLLEGLFSDDLAQKHLTAQCWCGFCAPV